MVRNSLFQDSLSVVLALLVGWASLLLLSAWGLPTLVGAVVGSVAFATLIAAHLQQRRAGTADPAHRPTIDARQAMWVLGALLVVAFLLRAYHLTYKPAWEDELWTWRNMYTSSYLELLRVAADDYWPPLHYLLLNTMARVTGTEMFWLRAPSVVFGVATVAAIYWAAMRLLQDRVAALLAAAFLTGATLHIEYSQEARVYSLLVFLTVLSSAFFFQAHRQRRVSPAYVGTTLLLVYSHSFASWYFVAAQSVYVLLAWLLWRDGKAFWKGFVSQLWVLILWLPVVAAFLYARSAHQIVVPTGWATGSGGIPWLPDIVELYQGLMVRSWPGAGLMALLMGLAVAALFYGLYRAGGTASPEQTPAPEDDPKRMTEVLLYLVCWSTVPLLFSLVVTWFTSLDTFGANRYHLTALPGLVLLAAAGTRFLGGKAPVAAVAALAVILPALELPRYYQLNRAAVDEAARIVKEHQVDEDEPIYIGNKFRSFYYYYRGVHPPIGSPRFDSLSAAYRVDETREEWHRLAAAGDQDGLAELSATPGSNKWADTYAYERLPRRIHHEGFRGLDGYLDWIRRETARGGFQEPYWVIYHLGPLEGQMVKAFEMEGVTCEGKVTYEVRELMLWHCTGQGSPAPSG
ncbi:MAG: glycosyltransferase family 39 protein [Gemmatimonadota bacterium]|jgi:hypothetical protein